MTASGFPAPEWRSECCGADMTVRGEGLTHWTECRACGEPCAPTRRNPIPADGPDDRSAA